MSTTTAGSRREVRGRQFAVSLFAAVALVIATSATATLLAFVPSPVLETLVIVASWYVGMAVALAVPLAVLRLVLAVTARG